MLIPHVNLSQTSPIKENGIKKKTVIILEQWVTSNWQTKGNFTFSDPLFNVYGLKVRSVRVQATTANTGLVGGAQSPLLGLFSSELSNIISNREFVLGSSLDTTEQTGFVITNLIGIDTSADNQNSPYTQFFQKDFVPFASYNNIKRFDWSIAPLNGTFTMGAADDLTCEIVIDFYVL